MTKITVKVGKVYITAAGQLFLVTKLTGGAKNKKVHYMKSSGKDISKPWQHGGGPQSQGGTKIETFLKKISREVRLSDYTELD